MGVQCRGGSARWRWQLRLRATRQRSSVLLHCATLWHTCHPPSSHARHSTTLSHYLLFDAPSSQLARPFHPTSSSACHPSRRHGAYSHRTTTAKNESKTTTVRILQNFLPCATPSHYHPRSSRVPTSRRSLPLASGSLPRPRGRDRVTRSPAAAVLLPFLGSGLVAPYSVLVCDELPLDDEVCAIDGRLDDDAARCVEGERREGEASEGEEDGRTGWRCRCLPWQWVV
mmetsp:Transcript_16309/g.51045  ORF Transcript_16309/g.51045 Transcript_16309/m.51045 type:complete len:228 (+) Transcript_16309:341-1024(+)